MTCFTAAIRRFPGGVFAKTPKSQVMTAIPANTTLTNVQTYFSPWPKHRSEFIMYGLRRQLATSIEQERVMHQEHSDMGTNFGSLYGGSGTASVPGKAAEGPAAEEAQKAAAAAGRALGLAGLQKRIQQGKKVAMVTAYDFPSARLARQAGVEMVLVGDSLGNCRLGLLDTVGVTMEDMLRATSAVRKGVEAQVSTSKTSPKPIVIGDMPFGSYLMPEDALRNAAALRLAGAEMVKLEGGRHLAPMVRLLTNAGIAVMSHIGLEPQKALLQGGLRLQGTTAKSAAEIVEDAKELINAGAVALVVECVPEEVGLAVQASVPEVPVIGIGAGGQVAGQVLVCDDMLGMHGRPPSFAKMFADVGKASALAYDAYVKEVRSGDFPGEQHSRRMRPEELEKLQALLPEVLLKIPSKLPEPTPPKVSTLACAANRSPGESGKRSGGASAPGGFELLPGGHFLPLPRSGPSPARFARGISQVSACSGKQHIPVAEVEDRQLKRLNSIQELRAWREMQNMRSRRVAFVPTMGNLHEGHLELVDEAKRQAEEVLVSIFVNPSQFAANEDLATYPRTLEEDMDKLRARGASAVFTPQPAEMYPSGSPGSTLVVPTWVEGKSEAASRPHFFTGVATVCLKLFNLCQPDVAIFGQKDAMQCVVISRMLEDLMLDGRISMHVAPTSREADGLARSSRNSYLTVGMRQKAPAIYRALSGATKAPSATAGEVRSNVRQVLEAEGMEVSYVSVSDTRDMNEKADDAELTNSVVSIACLLEEDGKQCRLIDNVVVPGSM